MMFNTSYAWYSKWKIIPKGQKILITFPLPLVNLKTKGHQNGKLLWVWANERGKGQDLKFEFKE